MYLNVDRTYLSTASAEPSFKQLLNLLKFLSASSPFITSIFISEILSAIPLSRSRTSLRIWLLKAYSSCGFLLSLDFPLPFERSLVNLTVVGESLPSSPFDFDLLDGVLV